MTARREIDVSQGDIWNISSALWLSSFFPEYEKNASFNSAFQSKFNLAKKLAISHLAGLPKAAMGLTTLAEFLATAEHS